jgi:hypothetical protein
MGDLCGNAPRREADELGQELLLPEPWLRAQQHVSAASALATQAPAAAVPVPVDLDLLLQRLVRRAAWGGDGRRGTARLELGSGELTGATLTVSAVDGEVAVELELPPGAAPALWQERISERLAARGIRGSVRAR